jgi:hypothetical protein
MKKISLLIVLGVIQLTVFPQDLRSPAEFLGYELGTQLSWHHDVLSYFKYVADKSELVDYRSYGKTYEGRELGVVFISSPENLQKLEQYRRNNLISIGLLEGSSSGKQIPFIWLAFNIHGNEAAGTEAALKTLYTLGIQAFEGTQEWLDQSIIIIDPCQNPDGRDRNTARYRMTNSGKINVNKDDWSHHESWPDSRTNHYLFDLNRDWIWQTQIETVQRTRFYNKYMPHVFVDFHEMPFGNTFFFPPAAKPWHETITPWQQEFHQLIGDETSNLFDEHLRLYFTKEFYDILYPGYGDSWPLFNGSMGLTVEQSRNVSTGINVKLDDKDTLTLKERIDGHFLAAMGTLKVSLKNREKLINEFNTYFSSGSENPLFEYSSIVIKGTNPKPALLDLLEILEGNQIRYSFVDPGDRMIKGFDYLGNKEGEFIPEKGDILVSAYQPQSHLVKVLFDPDTKLSDSLTFGHTAWALPYLYNVKAYAAKDRLRGIDDKVAFDFEPNSVPETSPYAFIANWKGFSEARFMSELFKKDINIRYALKSFNIGGKAYNRGTLIITKADNSHLVESLDKIVIDAANRCKVTVDAVNTGLSDKGADLGSLFSTYLSKKPEIALIGGKEINSQSFGQLWYFFENEIDYPLTILRTDYLNSVDLSYYDLILMPSGDYTDFSDTLFNYVKAGGRLAAFESAIELFASDTITDLSASMKKQKEELEIKRQKILSSDSTHLRRFEDKDREHLTKISAGSIYRVQLDDSHPYVFGLGKEWFIIKGPKKYPFLSKGENIGYILDSIPVSGFAGSEFRKEVGNTLVIGTENIGKGEVIYLVDDPYTKAFWKSGRILLGNILFRK